VKGAPFQGIDAVHDRQGGLYMVGDEGKTVFQSQVCVMTAFF